MQTILAVLGVWSLLAVIDAPLSWAAENSVTLVGRFDEVTGRATTHLTVGPGGHLYGVTERAVYRVDPGGLTVLHEFPRSDSDGLRPSGGLVFADDGYLYGVTMDGGQASQGTIFRLKSVDSYEVVHHFAGVDGRRPRGTLVKSSDGALYGVAELGGAYGFGTIFKVKDRVVETVHDFDTGGGRYPQNGLTLLADGSLLGATGGGGLYGFGGWYVLEGRTVTDIYYYSSTNNTFPSGVQPQGPGATSGEWVYGCATFGGDASNTAGGFGGGGVVFELGLSGKYRVIHTFVPDSGANCFSGLSRMRDGKMYGTTQGGGVSDAGTIFRVLPSESGEVTFEKIYDFSLPAVIGGAPRGGLVEGPDGALYGATSLGGENELGAVYRLLPGDSSLWLRVPVDGHRIILNCGLDERCAGKNARPYHTGVDLGGDRTVRAAAHGTVANILNLKGADHGLGNSVILAHLLATGEVLYTMYSHLDSIDPSVQIGKCMPTDEPLGTMGGSGYGRRDYWGVHLHFELKTAATFGNPEPDTKQSKEKFFGYTPKSALEFGYRDPIPEFGKMQVVRCN